MATDDRAEIRARWDAVEAQMRAYLEQLQDTTLFNQPIVEPAEDKDLTLSTSSTMAPTIVLRCCGSFTT